MTSMKQLLVLCLLFKFLVGSSGMTFSKLVASDPENSEQLYYGYSVSMDDESRTLVVGSPRDIEGGFRSGAVYIYTYNDDDEEWQEFQKIVLDVPENEEAFFGFSVAINKNRIVVGCPYDSSNGIEWAGAVYIFEYNDDDNIKKWVQTDKLFYNYAEFVAYPSFGASVAIENDIIVVGVPDAIHETQPRGWSAGAVSIFELYCNDTTSASGDDDETNQEDCSWVHKQKIVASDSVRRARFGESVSISNNVILVGSNTNPTLDDRGRLDVVNVGDAYIFVKDKITNRWKERSSLANDFESDLMLEENDRFGRCVNIYENFVAVGSPNDDDAARNYGALYVWQFDELELFIDDSSSSSNSGSGSGSSSGDDDVDINYNKTIVGNTTKLITSLFLNPLEEDVGNIQVTSGTSCIIRPDFVLIGVTRHPNYYGTNQGVVYMDNFGNENLIQVNDLVGRDLFGYSMDVGDNDECLVISGIWHDETGAVWVSCDLDF